MQEHNTPERGAGAVTEGRYRLTKHEGLGNDFLVWLDDGADGTAAAAVDPDWVRRLCDRRRGVGADGLLRARHPAADAGSGDDPVDVVMELYNADGSRAEMSGNGIRCLAQALLMAHWVEGPEMIVATDAGPRAVTVVEAGGVDGATHALSVEMGEVDLLAEASEWVLGHTFRARWANVGNPHLVLEAGDADAIDVIDLEEVGEKVNASVLGGANVHLVAPGGSSDRIVVRTYERGVGLTQACGTGASASAAVALGWGLVWPGEGQVVQVMMPGGTAGVVAGDAGAGESTVLIGPARSVAVVEYPWP